MDGQLVGFDAEIAEIDGAVAGAVAGRGRVLVITGPAGIGKTSLVRHARAQARRSGAEVRHASGHELERMHSFAVARQLLEGSSRQPHVGSTAVDGVIERLLREVTCLVWPDPEDARHRPVLVAVDDLQWVDVPSARFVSSLADRVDDLPLVLVLGLRPGEGPEVDALVRRLLGAEHVTPLRPGPLDAEGVEKVLSGHGVGDAEPRLAAAVHAVTGGNPFYTHAVGRLLTAHDHPGPEAVAGLVPDDVLRSVLARLARTADGADALAEALAVLGGDTPLRLVARLAGLDPAHADRVADALATAGILESGEPLRFTHSLVAAAVREAQPAFALSRRHRRAADLLLEEAAAPERVGSHLLEARADKDTTVVLLLREAAGAALHRGDPAAAVTFLERALAEPPEPRLGPDVALELLDARVRSGDRRVLEEVEPLLATLGPGAERARALGMLAALAHHMGDLSQAVTLAQRGLAELPEDERRDGDLLARWLSSAYLHPAHHHEAADVLRTFIAAARDGRSPRSATIAALAAIEATYVEPDEIVHRLAGVAFAQHPLVDDDALGTGIGYAGAALVWTDGFSETTRRMTAAIERATEQGAAVARAIAHHWRGIAAFHEARLDDALTDAEDGAALHDLGWTDSGWSLPLLADVRLMRGEVDLARQTVERAMSMDPGRPDYAQVLESRARLRLAEDLPESALEDALTAGSFFERIYGREPARAFGWRLVASEACLRLDEPEQARAHAVRAVEALRPLGTPRQLAEALTALAQASPDDEAAALLEEALTVLTDSTAQLARIHARLALGAVRRRLGARDEARELLYSAFEAADVAGALPYATQARRELHALGNRPRRAAREGLASLTPSERRVAELVAAGLSNPQVAHHLFLSRRTVESHLARAYRKLNIAGRTELEAVVGPRTDVP